MEIITKENDCSDLLFIGKLKTRDISGNEIEEKIEVNDI